MKSSVYFGLLQLAAQPRLHTLHKSALSPFLLSRDHYSQLLSTCLWKKYQETVFKYVIKLSKMKSD